MCVRFFIVAFLTLWTASLGERTFADEQAPPKNSENKKKIDQKKGPNTENRKAAVIDVNPLGKPPGKIRGVWIWYEKGSWHVRYRAKNERCKGVIRVDGGTVAKIFDFGGMEVSKKPAKEDLGMLSPDKKKIAFRLHSHGHEDGFSFKVTNNAKKLIFNIQEGDYSHPERIHIGEKGISPSEDVFELPALPNNP